ncbi:MAG: DUF934 domain-containing protein [Pseudomonadota bacterium]
MSALIRNHQIVPNDVVILDDEAVVPQAGNFIVSLARWQKDNVQLRSLSAEIGVRLPNTADLTTIWADIQDRKLIALDFPGFADGRAYSQARLLRDRYGFKGEILAIGAAVVRDQIQGMQRSGINSFLLRADQDPNVCLTAFSDFASAYQRATDSEMSIPREQRRSSSV